MMLSSRLSRRLARPASFGAARFLNVHEYISMELMNEHGIVTPKGFVASTPEEAEQIYETTFHQRK